MKITKRNMTILCFSLVCITGVTSLGSFLKYIDSTGLKIAVRVGLNLLNGMVAWVAMKLTGMKPDIDFRNKRQYLIGGAIALALSVGIAVIPALCGFSLVGNHADFSWFILFYKYACENVCCVVDFR